MRRTTMLLAAGLLLAGTAVGCGGSDKPAAKPSPSKTASKEDRYLDTALDLPYTDGRPTNEELLAFPPKWCKELESGHSVKYMFNMQGPDLYPYGLTWGLKKADANELLVAGVKAYCPASLDAVTEELRAAGDY